MVIACLKFEQFGRNIFSFIKIPLNLILAAYEQFTIMPTRKKIAANKKNKQKKITLLHIISGALMYVTQSFFYEGMCKVSTTF